MTTLEKLQALLPEKRDTRLKPIIGNTVLGVSCISPGQQEDYVCEIYNQALSDISSLLPKMIEVVREDTKLEISEKVRSIRGCPLPDTYSEDDDVIDKNDVLELLK